MGISGHMLGDRKLRRLRRLTGIEHIDRAYRRGHHTEARVSLGGTHFHIRVEENGIWTLIHKPSHWTSCDTTEPRFAE